MVQILKCDDCCKIYNNGGRVVTYETNDKTILDNTIMLLANLGIQFEIIDRRCIKEDINENRKYKL